MKSLKMLALLLALLLTAGLFSACTGPDGQQGSSGGDTLVANSEVDTTISDEYVYRMPITDGETFTYWVAFSSTVIDSPAEKYSLQDYENKNLIEKFREFNFMEDRAMTLMKTSK